MTETEIPSPVAQLALAWLACRPDGAGPRAELVRGVARAAGGARAETLAAALDELGGAGLVALERRRVALSGEGRAAAARVLGVDQLPAGLRWAAVQRLQLPARILGTPLRKGDAATLRAAILRRAYGLDLADDATLSQTTDGLGWKLLGIASTRPFTRAHVIRALLERAAGEALPGRDLDAVVAQVAARGVGARRADPAALRAALVRGWLGVPPEAGAEAEAVAPPPPDFPRRVLDAARASPSGRFGDDKVFISHVYRQLGEPGLSLDAFKDRLVDAHRAGALSLVRADLVGAMDPRDVAESETHWDVSTFHFVRLQETSP